MAKRATQEQREFFFVDTLEYEVLMMRETHRLLRAGGQTQVLVNALVESFCNHARNLIEFFKDHRDCDFDPRWFTNGYALQKQFVGNAVLSRIAKQIAHISKLRMDERHNKIGAKEQDKIKADIERELDRFCRHLKPPYDRKWKIPPHHNYRAHYARALISISQELPHAP